MTISAVLIVADEEKKIERCLSSLIWADEIIVVDGGSKDRTLELAKRYTNKIYHRTLDNFANQKNYGVDLATGDWILSIDADERVSPQLRDSLCEASGRSTPFDGFHVKRTNLIFDKELRFGGQHREKILRFFRKGKGKFEQPIHERVVVQGKVGELAGKLFHDCTGTVENYMRKLNLYTDFEARWMAEKGVKPNGAQLWLFPPSRFIYNYFFRLGFLDGYEGFLYQSLSSAYYFLKYAKLRELKSRPHENRN